MSEMIVESVARNEFVQEWARMLYEEYVVKSLIFDKLNLKDPICTQYARKTEFR